MDMDYAMLRYLGFMSAESSTVLPLLLIGAIYFLAPAMGYSPAHRSTLLAAIWAMVAKLAVGLFRTAFMTMSMLGGNQRFQRPSSGGGLFPELEQLLMSVLPLLESLVFVAAMILFVLGLYRLKRKEEVFPRGQPPPSA